MRHSPRSPFVSSLSSRSGTLPSTRLHWTSLPVMKLTTMPEQEAICAEEGVLCGLAEVEERRSFGRSSWDKQMIVLQPSGCLLIYKYYLLGKGKGLPEIGRIVHLNELHRLSISMKRITLTVELTGKNKAVTRLRFEGELVPIWGAKLFLYKISLPGLMHSMHTDKLPLGFFVDKDLVEDAPFEATKTALYLQSIDRNRVSIVSLKMEVGLFNSYSCFSLTNWSVRTKDLAQALSFCTAKDSVEMVYEGNNNKDELTLTYHDNAHAKVQDVSIKLVDGAYENLEPTEKEYHATITMPSSEFQKTIRNLASISDTLTIKANQTGVIFYSKGNSTSATIKCTNEDEDDDKLSLSSVSVERVFEMKSAVSTNSTPIVSINSGP